MSEDKIETALECRDELIKTLVEALKPSGVRIKGWRDMLNDGVVKQPISKEWLKIEDALKQAKEMGYE